MAGLRVVFMGTPDFAVPALAALIEAGHDVAAVYTRPPKPAGRGERVRASPVQNLAEAKGIPVVAPRRLRDADVVAQFREWGADIAVICAYGLILPPAILGAPRLGCINIHASLLPRWRGAAPIQRAILAGDTETGITIMRMDEGLDTGDSLLAEAVPITAATTATSLHDALAALGARLVLAALDGLAAGTLGARAQPAEGVTLAPRLDRAEGEIDWRRPAVEIARKVRALNPWPGTWFVLDGERIKLLAVEIEEDAEPGAPGTVLDDRLTIACGGGQLRPLRLQRAARRAMTVEEFLRGRPVPAGARLAVAPNGER